MILSALKTTGVWSKWWANRKIDWNKDYLATWNHPHRFLISYLLQSMGSWVSLIELGCGSGPNLMNIVKTMKGKQVGGIDISPEAIDLANKTFKNGVFRVGSVDNLMLSDKATDVILTDMCLIYVDPLKIRKCLREIKRVARKYVLLCEFHHPSFWKRMILRLRSGYNAYDYPKLLTKMGFHDVMLYKIPENAWPGGDPQKTYGYIIIAKVPRR